MSGCGNCGGSCENCTGCTGALVLTEGELALLQRLSQIPFLPVARQKEDMTPVYLEDSAYSKEEYSLILQCMEKKNLVAFDYSVPLKGFGYEAYGAYPVKGSVGLTERGQQVLELMDIQGTN